MINKSDLLAALKADLKAAEIKKRDLDAARAKYKNEHDGKPYGNEVAGKSSIVSRDIKRQDEWRHASIIDPFVSTPDIIKCAPVTFEDSAAAQQNELVLNTQFCRQFNRFNFMTKSLKVLSKEGTVVIQTGWDYEDEEVETEVPDLVQDEFGNIVQKGVKTVTQTKIKKNQPTAVVCRNEDIYLDPTCMDDMDKCQFVIYRYETNLSTLRQDGRYKNLDKIMTGMAEATNNGDSYFPEDPTYFRFKDEPRKKIVVYEYWGNYDMNEDGIAEAIVCAWVNGVIIRLESNPYPDQKPPFIVVPFNPVPFQMQGESDGELLSDIQKVKTAIIRGTIDNMAQSTNGQKGIKKGALDALNKKRFLNGENFEYNTVATDFFDGHYNQIPNTVFDMFTYMNNEAETLTGVKAFGPVNGGNSLSATAARGVMDATATRRLNLVRNISENMIKPILRKWMSYNAEFLEPEQVMRITNEQFVNIKRDDLMGNIDLDIQVSTNEDNAAKAQELSFMLQTTAQGMDTGLHQMILAEIARLHKMPDLAKKIETFQPQPDPYAEQIKQLNIQKLQAEIDERQALAQKNGAEVGVKQAKALLDQAKTRDTHSKADMTDLNFLEKESGQDKQHEIDMAQMQHDADMYKQHHASMHALDSQALDNIHDSHMIDKQAKLQKLKGSAKSL